MAEVAEKHPSLPANYVSLVQLQERWLKEQQRKHSQKEEEERKQKENEGEELKREKTEKNTASSSVSNDRRPFRRSWNGEESRGEIVKSKKQMGNGERKAVSSSVSNNRRWVNRNRNSEELQIESVGEKVREETEKSQKQIVNGERKIVSNSVSYNRGSFNRKVEESKSENVRVQDEQIDGESKKKKKSMEKNKREKEEEEELKREKKEKQNNSRPFRRNRNSEELQIENVGEKVEDSGENQKQIVNGERKIESNNRQFIFQKPEGSQSKNVGVQGELIDGESKMKKKWKKNKQKPKVQENLTGGNELEEKNPVDVSEGKEAEKKIPVVVSEGKGKMVAVRVQYRPKSYNHRAVNQTVEIGRKFEDLSLKEGNVRSQRRYNRDFGRFGRPKMEKLSEGGLMWVVKGERIDTDAQVYC